MHLDLLPEIREHLRIPPTGEDALLGIYLGAALDFVRAFTGQEWPEVDEEGLPAELPAGIKAALFLLVGGMYENRESEGIQAMHENPAVMRLLWPHRSFD